MDLKKYISQKFEIDISDELINIISNCQKQNDRLKSYAVIGDKMVDFLDSLYNKEKTSSEMDRFRQNNSSDEFWVKCFDFWGFKDSIIWNASNPLGKEIKATRLGHKSGTLCFVFIYLNIISFE